MKTIARLRRKPARLAVRILCLNYFAQKRFERERKKTGAGKKKGRMPLLTSHLRFHGALNRCESSPRKSTHRCIFRRAGRGFKQRYATHALRNEMKRAACQARKCENPKCGFRKPFFFFALLLLVFFFNICNFHVLECTYNMKFTEALALLQDLLLLHRNLKFINLSFPRL